MLVSPLYDHHKRAGARFLEWGGWRLPAAYTSAAEEIRCVRTTAGYTDIPFLSHIVVRGPDAFATLQRLCTRNLEQCPAGKAIYTLALNDDGGVVDDCILLRLAGDFFIVSVPSRNALLLPARPSFLELKAPKSWVRPEPEARVSIHELGAFLVSVQGPRGRDLLRPAVNVDDLAFFAVCEAEVGEIPVVVSRTGFSGELGFEFLVWPEHGPALWETIAGLGSAHGAAPYGVEATMTMGLEKGYLMGRDFFPGSTPLEIGLAWAVDFEKPGFVGKQAVLRRRDKGIKNRLMGLELALEAPVPASDDPVLWNRRKIGSVTHAAASQGVGRVLARASLPSEVPDGAELAVVTGGVTSRAVARRQYCWYDPGGHRLRS